MRAERKRRDRLKDEAQRDQLRKDCADSLFRFVEECWHVLEPATDLKTNWAIRAMCDLLERVTAGQIQFLLINVPPGMMKSLLVSVIWPAWEWGPKGLGTNRFLTTSYSLKNVHRDNGKMRRLVTSSWFQTLWPEIKLSRSQNTKDKFDNEMTGGREGRSFEAMTGGRGDRVIVDDPHSVDGGESDVQRESAVQSFREGMSDRVNTADSAIVIIMQRIHESDVSGTVLTLGLGFVHLNLPMEYERDQHCEIVIDGEVIFSDPRTVEGELLFPERFPLSYVERQKLTKGDYGYAGQYQQRPAPREGGMFKPDQILIVEFVPGIPRKRVRGWDIAGSTRKTSPYTVGALLADLDGVIYIEDVKRQRAEIDQAENLIVTTAWNDGETILQSLPQDPGQSAKSQKFHVSKRLAGLNFKWSPESGAKQDRAIPFAAMVNSGMVRMVRGPWNAELIAELRKFPASTYKDQADALSRAYGEMVRPRLEDPGIAAPMILTAAPA